MTQDERIAASPEEIYLEPLDCACHYEGRQWCEDDIGSEDEMGAPVPWIKYVRADIAAKRERRARALSELAAADAEML